MPGMGGYDLKTVASAISKANPNLSPQALVSALTQANKLLNPEARMQLQWMQMQMRHMDAQARLDQARLRDDRQYGVGGGSNESIVDAIGNYQMAPLNMTGRNAVVARDIMARVKEKYPDYDAKEYAGELAGARAGGAAENRADAASLVKLQPQYDAVLAYEKNARRMGDRLVELAAKVDNTGIPVIERWVRAGRKRIAGDEDVAKFDAQIQLYRTEVARILTNPNLTGPLTDSARHEIENVLPNASTFGQIKAVVGLLGRDFDSRQQTLQEQIEEVKGRLKGRRSGGADTRRPTGGGGGGGQSVPMGDGWSVQVQ